MSAETPVVDPDELAGTDAWTGCDGVCVCQDEPAEDEAEEGDR